MTSDVTIGLLWHSANSGNLGVGALTLANIALLREACATVGRRPHFKILGFADPGRKSYVTGDDIDSYELNMRSMVPGGAFDRVIKDCDLVIDIGGGDSWTDIYASKRYAFLWWSKWRVLQSGVPLVFAPQTIGPFTRPIHTRLAAATMRRAALIVARDPASFDAAKAMSPATPLMEAVDVAFALPFQTPERGSDRRLQVGINVSGLLFNRGFDGHSSFGMEIDYPAYVRQLLAALSARPDTRIQLISHVESDTLPVEDDVRIARQLAQEFPAAEFVPAFADPIAAKSHIAGLDFVTAARMHACIAAYSSGVAVFPVAYSRKFSGLFEGVLEYPHGVPVRGVGTDVAVASTLAAVERHAELATATLFGRAKAAQRLSDYRDAISRLIEKHARQA